MKKLLYILLGGFLLSWAFKKGLRGIRDIILLCIVIAYSGAHMPTANGVASVGHTFSQAFNAGYQRGYARQSADN
jgi:hypothetical protein